VRGKFTFGNNQYPIQNFYLQEPVKDAEGVLTLKTVATIVENDKDKSSEKCPMK
jgi:branched-chain amino acid transport system substrate-binding protein